MVSTGSYLLGAAALAALALSLGFGAVRLRKRLLPTWTGAPAHLVEAIVAIALLIWLGELLGLFNVLYGWTLVASSLLLAGALARFLPGPTESPAGGGVGGASPEEASTTAGGGGSPAATGPAGQPPSSQVRGKPPTPTRGPAGHSAWSLAIAVAVIAVVFAHWGLTTKDALDRGVFNFDSLWYHMPFATEIAKSHSVTGLHYTETVFTNWFYPQNSELLHAVGILLTQRDTLSLFLNFGWLAVAFLAAWCIGRPRGRGHLTVIAAAIVLECHTLVVREPGAAKNDLMAAALLLAAIAILVNAWAVGRRGARPSTTPDQGCESGHRPRGSQLGVVPDERGGEGHGAPPPPRSQVEDSAKGSLPGGWSLAAAGLATGLAAGTKSTAVAMAAALTLAVIVLAPAGRRRAAAAWWLLPALAGGGFWYLRNLIAAGNPLPQIAHLGPIALPHPERLQSGRPDFSIAHYATDTAVWREYFAPGLHQAFGLLWPLVVAAAVAGATIAVVRGRDRIVRWIGAVVLFGLLAYLVTPLSAAGAEGAPTGFAINIRYAIPALLAGIVLLPLAPIFTADRLRPPKSDVPLVRDPNGHLTRGTPAPAAWRDRALRCLPLLVLLAVLLVTDRSDAILRDPSRLFGLGLATLLVLIPAAIAWADAVLSKRHLPAGGAAGGTTPEEASATAGGGGSPAATGPAGRRRWSLVFAVTAVGFAVLAIGYPVERHYLRDRYANEDAETAIPGMHLDSAYTWARNVHDARIGLAGTTAGFLQFGFYGADLSNQVRYLGVRGPHGAFNAIPGCRGFRAAVNAAHLDYLVTAPFLDFIHPGRPVASPEAGWLRGEAAVAPLLRSGPVTVWRVRGKLDPAACGPANAPLHRIPQQPPA
jgi:hypothetical protein